MIFKRRMGKLLIIGIGGATCGGKTTVTKSLIKLLPNTELLSQDDFYWPDDSEHHVVCDEYEGYANYDVLQAYDMDTLLQRVYQLQEKAKHSFQSQILLIEGILIFNHRTLASLFDKKFFITLPKEECLRRREKQTYLPTPPPNYFEKIAWPLYLKHKEEIADQRDINYLDGTIPPDDLLEVVRAEIMKLTETVN